MNKYEAARILEKLAHEGTELTKETVKAADTKFRSQINAWRVAAFDALRSALPEQSELRNEFERLWQNYDPDEEDYPKIAGRVTRSVPLIIKAEDAALRRGDRISTEVEREVRLLIGSTFPKSPWFLIPGAAFLAAMGFAILGIFRIQDLQIDVRDQAQETLNQAVEQINARTQFVQASIDNLGAEAERAVRAAEDVTSERLDQELSTYVEAEKERIRLKGNERIQELLQERPPADLDSRLGALRATAAELDGQVSLLGQRVAAVRTEVELLDNAMNKLTSAAEQGLLTDLSNWLDRSKTLVLAEMIAVSLALALSIVVSVSLGIAWWRRRARGTEGAQ